MPAKKTTPDHKAIKDYYESIYYRNAGTAVTTLVLNIYCFMAIFD